MSHLQSVSTTSEHTSHWVARVPAGTTIEWDAEIVADEPGVDRLAHAARLRSRA